jgi:hypothetical protein
MTATTALDSIGSENAESIASHNTAMKAGAIVTIKAGATFSSNPYSYANISDGDTVAVSNHHVYGDGTVSRTVQGLDGASPHLPASGFTLTPVDPATWTFPMARAAVNAAEQAAADALESAMVKATGFGLGHKPENGDEKALALLAKAAELRYYAHAVKVLITYMVEQTY